MSAWLVPLLVGLTGPVFLLIRSARQFSGQIATTDASKLWDEANSIRQEYRDRIAALNEVIARHEGRIRVLEAANEQLEKENRNLENVIEKLTREVGRGAGT